jgi:protein phosphatase 1 regulatory subunit 11
MFDSLGCCIYSKPKIFGESSSSESDSDDDGCPHNAYCTGHKNKSYDKHQHTQDHDSQGPSSHQQSH